MAKYLKKEENTGREEGGITGAPQRQQSENLKLNTDTITDSIYSGPSGKIEKRKESGDENKVKTMEKYIGSDGEEGGETGASQQQQQKKQKF